MNSENAAGNAENQNEEHQEEISMEELLKETGEFTEKLNAREIVGVKVVSIVDGKVLVDIKDKKEGVIPLEEFSPDRKPEVGDVVDAVLVRKGSEKAYPLLSHKRARERKALANCEKIYAGKERVRGRIVEKVKGGYIVDLMGASAFMPLSLSELGGAHKHYLPENARVKVYIKDFDANNRKIIVSRREVLEEDEKERKKKIFSEIKPNTIVRAVVSKPVKDGLFIRYQGIEGFVRKEDLSWRNPDEEIVKYKRGQRIKCKILEINREEEKINFGIKQLTPNPVDLLRRKYAKKAVKGIVESVGAEGAKIKINEKIKGFVKPEDYGYEGTPAEGKEIRAMVFSVNPRTFELNLSIKKYESFEERKRMQKYMKEAPNLTLGQILGNMQDSEE